MKSNYRNSPCACAKPKGTNTQISGGSVMPYSPPELHSGGEYGCCTATKHSDRIHSNDRARNHIRMHKYSTTTVHTPQPEAGHKRNRYSKFWRCGFALVVFWVVSGCSTIKVQEVQTPQNHTSVHDAGVQVKSATSDDSKTPESDKNTTTLGQKNLQDEKQSKIKAPDSMSEFDYSTDKVDNSATEHTPGNDTPTSTAAQTSAQSQPQEVIVSTPAQTASAQPVQPPATIRQYTVKGGENLYTISSHPFIYADGMLWPLIYRANRDQIKDPRQIYPGQILNIPRDISEPDKEQARTKAKKSPIFAPAEQPSLSPATNK